jgi:hypothetical protein
MACFTILVSAYVGKDMKSNSELCGTYMTNTVTASDRATVRMTSQKELKEMT